MSDEFMFGIAALVASLIMIFALSLLFYLQHGVSLPLITTLMCFTLMGVVALAMKITGEL